MSVAKNILGTVGNVVKAPFDIAGSLLGGQQPVGGGGGGGPLPAAPKDPKYKSLADAKGKLQSAYTYDPNKSAAFTKLQEQAMATPGESPWAQMQLQKQGLAQSDLADQTAKASAQGLAQAQSGLARFGGLSSGARERLAMQGQKDLALGQQNVARQGMMDRLGITGQDIDRQQQLLGNVSSTELEGQGKNLSTLLGDVQSQRDFDTNKYNQQMAAYGAGRTANAQVTAAQNSRKK